MATGGVLIAELEKYYQQIEAIKQDAENLVHDLEEPQFNWRPEPNRWAIGDCFEHLNVTARLYWPILAQAINRARIEGILSPGPFKHSWLGNRFIGSLEPPPRIRFKAPRSFRPLANQPAAQVWTQFLSFQDRLLELIREANGVDLVRIKVQSPAFKFLKLTLGQAFAMTAAHERRHLWQARQVKEHPNFPK